MILRAIIVDDEQKGIDTLSLLIEMFVKDVKVVATSTDAFGAIELIENYKPEVVFLDINMPEMNGFELLEKISWKDFNLIFTTAHQEFAIRAIKNNAIDYLLKPIDHEDLSLAIERIKLQLNNSHVTDKFNYNELLGIIQQSQKNRLLINSRSGIETIEMNDIVCLESQSNYTKIYLADSRTLLTSKTLKEFENQLCLPELSFMRVHHSFIVNLNRVSKYLKTTDNIVLNDDLQVPVAKSRKDVFFKWLNI